MRKPYFVTLQNIEGSLVTININPIRSLEVSNNLVIESHDANSAYGERAEKQISRNRPVAKPIWTAGWSGSP